MLKYFQRVAPSSNGGKAPPAASPSKKQGNKKEDVSDDPTPLKRKAPPSASDAKQKKGKGQGGEGKERAQKGAKQGGKGGAKGASDVAEKEEGDVAWAGTGREPLDAKRTPPPPHTPPTAKAEASASPSRNRKASGPAESPAGGGASTRSSPRKKLPGGPGAEEGQRGPDTSPEETPAEHKGQDKAGVEGISDYEKLREANIARNNELLTSLDIARIPEKAAAPADARPKKRRGEGKPAALKDAPTEGRRTSSRLSSMATKEELVALPNSWEEDEELTAGGKARKPRFGDHMPAEREDIDAADLVPPPSMHDFQEELLRLQKPAVPAFCGAGGVDWEAFAKQRWGKHAGVAKGGEEVADWELFVTSRCPVLPDTPGSGYLQEDYCGDVYRLLIACVLMSRVSSHDTKVRCINGFFDAFPTPSDVKDAPDSAIQPIVKSLGLFDSRIQGIREVTTFFLEQKRFQIGLEPPIKPRGVGAFTYESYLIFCCGQGRLVGTKDKALSTYCAWLRRQPLGAEGGKPGNPVPALVLD